MRTAAPAARAAGTLPVRRATTPSTPRPAPRRPRPPLPPLAATAVPIPPPPRRAEVRPEGEVPGLTDFLDGLKFGRDDGLLVAIVQV